jgi:hypothetical protein
MSRLTEQRTRERYAELVAAVHRGSEGVDRWAAQCIVAAVTSTLRKQIADDLRGMCEAHGLPCTAGEESPCRCEWAASVARGVSS